MAIRSVVSGVVAVLVGSAGGAVAATPIESPPHSRLALATTQAGGYVPVSPVRLLATATGLTPGKVVTVLTTGVGGVPVGQPTVLLALSAVKPTSAGSMRVAATTDSALQTTDLSYAAGKGATNLVAVRPASDGKVLIANSGGSSQLTVDLVGYFAQGSAVGGGAWVPVARKRVFDSVSPVAPTVPATARVGGVNGIPLGASSALLTVTTVKPAGVGSVTVYATGAVKPSIPGVAFAATRNTTTTVISPLSADGRVSLATTGVASRLIVDVAGYFIGGTAGPGGYVPVKPTQVYASATALTPTSRGSFVLPTTSVPTGATAAVISLAAVKPAANGLLTAFAGRRPALTSLTYSTNTTARSTVVVPVSADRTVSVAVTGGATKVTAAVTGYISSGGTPLAPSMEMPRGAFVGGPIAGGATATGGSGAYSWTATGLPPGVVMSTDGALSGSPTSAGTYTTVATVTDTAGSSASTSATIVITALLPAECRDADGCASLSPTTGTEFVPTSKIGPFSVDSNGAPTAVIVTGLTTSTGSTLMLAPTEAFPTGVAVKVTSVNPRSDGTTQLTVTRVPLSSVFQDGSLVVKGGAIDQEPPSATSPGGRLPGTSEPQSAKPELKLGPTEPDARVSLSCDAGMNTELRGLKITPQITPTLIASLDPNPFHMGQLEVFQAGLDASITIDYGVDVSASGDCTLSFDRLVRTIPAGQLGAVVFTLDPELALHASARGSVRGSVTFTCSTLYTWWRTSGEDRVTYCRRSIVPLQVGDSTGLDASLTGTLDVTASLDGLVGMDGNLTAIASVGYHPTQNPAGVLHGKVTAAVGACLICIWEGTPARVTLWDKTIIDQDLATWGSVPAPPAPSGPVIATTSLPIPYLGDPYSAALVVADSRLGTWAISSGSLPEGLALSGDRITGKPTRLQTTTFTVRFTDNQGRAASRAFTLTVALGTGGSAGAIQDLSFCNAKIIAANDDGASDIVALPFQMTLGSSTFSNAYVGNNGYVTFLAPMSTFTPYPLVGSGAPILAPYFADVDTRDPRSSLVTYGVSPDGSQLCVNWLNVGYYAAHYDKKISAQLIVTRRSETGAGNFDATFNYGRLDWETGDASGGTGGIGGVAARAGWGNGAGVGYELPGSGISGSLMTGGTNSLVNASNVGVPGRYVFAFRAGRA